MTTWHIYFWHGYDVTLFDDLIKVVGCTMVDDDMIYEGSLDDFVARWKRPMMIQPDIDTISVTHHRSFGQR